MKKKLVFLLTATLFLTACNLKASQPEPNAIVTEAYQTAEAAMTLTATYQPTATATATETPTETPTPTLAPTQTLMPTSAPPTIQVVSSCDSADFVADVTIPDGTQFTPGIKFTKTWELRNSGTCTWTTAYRLVFYGGSAMGGPSAQQLTTTNIAPGQTLKISVELTAPTTTGNHVGYWLLQNASGNNFGIAPNNSSFYVEINVTGSGNSATPTTTQATPTSTLGPTQTPTMTATLEPTATTDSSAP